MLCSKIFLCEALLIMVSAGNSAQQLDEKSKTELILADNTHIILYRAYSLEHASNIYYYLPVNLHVSFNGNNPEISLLLFEEGNISGGILHFLLSWGLTGVQEEEAGNLLRIQLNDTAFIAGSVLVDPAPDSFNITSDDEISKLLRKGLSQNSQVPLIPGSKLAASFKFSGAEANRINEIVREPQKIGNGSIRMKYIYKTMVQDGYITKPVAHEWILELRLKDLFKYLK